MHAGMENCRRDDCTHTELERGNSVEDERESVGAAGSEDRSPDWQAVVLAAREGHSYRAFGLCVVLWLEQGVTFNAVDVTVLMSEDWGGISGGVETAGDGARGDAWTGPEIMYRP